MDENRREVSDVELPGAADVQEAIDVAESEEVRRMRWLQGSKARQLREDSRYAYTQLTSIESQDLLTRTFSSTFQKLNDDPARFLSDAQLIRPLGEAETSAVVSEHGDGSVLDAGIPVRAMTEVGTMRKVSLNLTPQSDGFRPDNPLTEISIPRSIGDPLVVGREGVEITPVGSVGESQARLLGEKNVFYPEVLGPGSGVDRLVSPISGGVEIFDQIRSYESPEEIRFQFEVPAGAELRTDGAGGAQVVREENQIVWVPFPSAVDAQGTPVQVDLSVEGNTLILRIPHRDLDVAYPLLVDPAVTEDWYNYSWFSGHNFQALNDGSWVYDESHSWIEASTSCIYACWGSGRGLFVSMPSGTQWNQQYGHWIYSAPNPNSYLSGAWANPFVRSDHNCNRSSYPRPHDYLGMWQDGQWNLFINNMAITYGYAEIPSSGSSFILGLSTGGGNTSYAIPCWRDLAVGGAAIWLDDPNQPVLTTTSSTQWMDTSPVRLNVKATDIGLGVRKFEAEATSQTGVVQKWDTWYPCIGTVSSPCPETWNLNELGQPQLTYSPSVLPEGIRALNVTAFDATLRKSTTTNTMTVRVDHTPPEIKLSGTITQQNALGTERPKYTVRVDAKDGEPLDDGTSGNDPTKDRSGVINISQWVDGAKVNEFAPGCATQNCSHFDEGAIEAAAYSKGKHTLAVKSTDKLGHVASQSLDFYLGDSQAPSLNVTGLPAESSEMPTQAIHWKTFGANGASDGQLKQPSDVAIDAQGDLWVADKGNNRIQKLSSSGQFLAKFGSTGAGNGQFSSPASIAIDPKGNIWVADKGNSRVQKFNAKGDYLAQFGSKGSGSGQFTNGGPEGIAIDAKGNIWVSDTYAGRVLKFDENGTFLKIVGTKGAAPGQLGEPTGIDVAPNGNVWVADWQNNRVSVFSEGGGFIKQFGTAGSGDGQFNRPDAIAVGSRGDVWVGDQDNGRVQEFDQNGTFIGTFGSSGSGTGQFNFNYPMGVATDSKGSVWVADTNNHRIQRWLVPNTTVSGYLDPLSASAIDSGFGMGSIAVKLTDATGATEVVGQKAQSCGEGGCALSHEFEELDLSEKPSGTYMLTVVATDVAGNVREAARVLNIDSSPPEIELSGPLAESAGQPLTASSTELKIDASDSDSGSEGVSVINIERDGRLVATYPSDCSSSCTEAEASYLFESAGDGADRSIIPVSAADNGTIGELRRVSCVTPNDCWSIGRTKYTFAETMEGKVSEELLEHWDGSEWQATPIPKPVGAIDITLEDISCASTSICVAVGSYDNGSKQPLTEFWDGTKWTAGTGVLPAGVTMGLLKGVSCGSPSDCWVHGETQITFMEMLEGKVNTPFFSHWDGNEWQARAIPKPSSATSITLEDIACASATTCIAVGSYDNGSEQPLTEIWDGSKWTAGDGVLPAGITMGKFKGVSCGSSSDCWVHGENQLTFMELMEGKAPTPFFSHWDGDEWQLGGVARTPDSSPVVINSLSCASRDSCTAVGRNSNPYGETLPLAYTWDAAGWRFQPMPMKVEATTSSLEAVSCAVANECRSVGYSSIAPTGPWHVLAEAERLDGRSHEIAVEAIDVQGNATREAIEIDVAPDVAEQVECDDEPQLETPKGVLSPSQAIISFDEALPAATAPTEAATTATANLIVDPSYGLPSPNLRNVHTLATGGTSAAPGGGLALGNSVCMAPAALTPAATQAVVVNADSALYANVGPETDMVIRPNAMGATVIHSLRGPNSPETLGWNVTVAPGEDLVELPSGDVAVVKVGSVDETSFQERAEPAKSPGRLNDAEFQIESGEYHLTNAVQETGLEVVAVIARPWIVLSQGTIVPVLIDVVADSETPNEFEIWVKLPETPEEAAVWPVQMVTETASASAITRACSVQESPCGYLNLSAMARYAVYWANEANHYARNPAYVNYGSNDCTNFVSQTLRAGGGLFMRPGKHEDATWWYLDYSNGVGQHGKSIASGGFDNSESWRLADVLPRHWWRFGLAYIDPVQQPRGWTKGNIVAADWFESHGVGDVNHLFIVVGTHEFPGKGREPLVANHSTLSYPNKPWFAVRARVQDQEGSKWGRFALSPRHRIANVMAKKHNPDNLYGPGGLFRD